MDKERLLGRLGADRVIAGLERHKAVPEQEAGSGRRVPSGGRHGGRPCLREAVLRWSGNC